MHAPDPPDLPSEPEPADLSADAIEEAVLEGESLAGQHRRGLRFIDCLVRDCDLANLDARAGTWRRVELNGGRLTGCDLSEAELADVTVQGCRAELLSLGASRLDRVHFLDCELRQAFLQQASLRAVVFERCDLSEADLSGTRFAEVELRGCRLDGATGLRDLRGVAMPWQDIVGNAGIFAAACGVEVLE